MFSFAVNYANNRRILLRNYYYTDFIITFAAVSTQSFLKYSATFYYRNIYKQRKHSPIATDFAFLLSSQTT